jgi:signal transduction histidine kinase
MRQEGRFALRHVVLLVVLALVLNAQFTWWVVYSLRENSIRLQLQRQLMVEELRRAALGLALRLQALEASLPAGSVPSPRPPFTSLLVIPRELKQRSWEAREGGLALLLPLSSGLVAELFLPQEALSRWLEEEAPGAVLLPPGSPRPRQAEVVPLDGSLAGYALIPDRERWAVATVRYQRRVLMVVTEGVFFWLGMAAIVALLWRMLRQESVLEQQRQNFISAVTHELKTPIAGIRLALETVLSGRAQGPAQEQFLRNALADAERLQSLVEKVLELTRFASGVHRLHIQLADLSQLVEEELAAALPRAKARGIQLVAEILPGVQVPHDGEAVAIVLSNLLENAFKYAAPAEPKVWVRLWVEEGQAVLEVADNGIGISPEDLPKIFSVFYRGGDEVARRTPGTGIGLFVAKEIAKAHGGKLLAESEGPGKGARFRLVLPGAALVDEEGELEYDTHTAR